MTGRTKTILVVLIGAGVGFLLFRASERTWGSRMTGMIARTFQAAPIQTGDLPTFKVEIAQVAGGLVGNTIEIPEPVFQALMPRDSYEQTVQAVPFLGLQAYHHKATRDGKPVAEWDEGFALLYAGIGLAAIVIGVVVTAVLTILVGALGLKKAPNV